MSVMEINWRPDTKQLRTFAFVWLVGFALVGAVVAWRAGAFASAVPVGWHRPWLAPLVIWAAAAVVGIVGVVVPAAVRPVYLAWMGIAFPIGFVVSHVLLAVVYFIVFAGCGLVFRLLGRDPLNRSFDKAAMSYWVERGPAAPPERYFKQF